MYVFVLHNKNTSAFLLREVMNAASDSDAQKF